MIGSYINAREVTKRFRVDPGHYLISKMELKVKFFDL